jgi:membrane-associated phospholipid phosphatase
MILNASAKDGEVSLISLTTPTRDEFIEQLEVTLNFADLRAERTSEILSQVVPQTAYWSSIAGLTPERHRYTLELLGIGLRFAMMIIMRFKYLLNCPRPVEYTALVQPMILTPGYSAYPSGHATEAYFAAEFLADVASPTLALLEKSADLRGGRDNILANQSLLRGQLHRLAFRIAENRVVAGLHFPVDSMAGQLLGCTIARYFIARCCKAAVPSGNPSEQSSVKLWRNAGMKPEVTLGRNAMPKLDTTLDKDFFNCPEEEVMFTPLAPVLATLWSKARVEHGLNS